MPTGGHSGLRVVVIGAGIVGAACAYYLSRDGHRVTVLDRGAIAGGTSSRGEGNLLVSDKGPGPELELALYSSRLWREIGDDVGPGRIELEAKGGVVVAASSQALSALQAFAHRQRAAGVETVVADPTDLVELEPLISPDLAGGVSYPQDLQVQPVLAVAALLRAARSAGATVRRDTEVVGALPGGRSRSEPGGVLTTAGPIVADVVINAAGTWSTEVARRLGGAVPVLPRRGFVLVTEPLPPLIRHKVYSADYVANVASGSEGLETSAVVEATPGGPVLIGASRERVGFDSRLRVDVVRVLAGQAIAIFPFLSDVALMRVYHGFRPYCPDHLPVIGPDPRVPGLWHACGHEGAGVGLAPATGALIADLVAGRPSAVDPEPFAAHRFADRVRA